VPQPKPFHWRFPFAGLFSSHMAAIDSPSA